MSEADFDCEDVAPSGDISGRGVRLSFYIQGACLIISALYSQPDWRMVGTSAPFAVTGIVYAICTVALGFMPEPEITIYDAIISNSLGGIALLSVLTLALIFYLKHDTHSKVMRTIMGGQALVLIASAISVTYAIPDFGLHPQCFTHVYWAFFGKMRITTFRTIQLVFYLVYLVAIVCFILFRFKDHLSNWYKSEDDKRKEARQRRRVLKKLRLQNYWKLVGTLVVSALVYVVLIVYIEVLRYYNRTMMAESDGWSFGQIMAFALCIIPVLDTIHFIRRYKDEFGSYDPMVVPKDSSDSSPLMTHKPSSSEDYGHHEDDAQPFEEPEGYQSEKPPGHAEEGLEASIPPSRARTY
ncbi:hypothetical protein AX16_006215 [Volvariella volvacea WC 439]|nr:hypothetical protein AX16_006215 [Volvariella volvacea WC 439]